MTMFTCDGCGKILPMTELSVANIVPGNNTEMACGKCECLDCKGVRLHGCKLCLDHGYLKQCTECKGTGTAPGGEWFGTSCLACNGEGTVPHV